MSHVVSVKLQILDLDLAEQVFREVGCTLVRDQLEHTYWNGRKSSCLHAVKVPGTKYEIGVVEGEDGAMTLAYDGYDGVIDRVCGKKLQTVNEDYVRRVTRKRLGRKGFKFREQRLKDGRLQLCAYK